MFRDCWDYICYKIQDTILKNGQKQNRKKQENINRTTHRKAGFLLQKTAVVIAGILWLIAAARVFWNMPQTGVQENVLSAFGSASYKEVCADISAYGKYGSMELTDTAKEIILEKAAEKICETYHCAVLLKGGHQVHTANDILCSEAGKVWFNGKRIDNPNTHGTGCTLSSAIASNLANNMPLREAVGAAKEYISAALADMLDLGRGSGPMNHGFALCKKNP